MYKSAFLFWVDRTRKRIFFFLDPKWVLNSLQGSLDMTRKGLYGPELQEWHWCRLKRNFSSN